MGLCCLMGVTVLEASGKLYIWFTENDSFLMEDNFSSAVVVTVDEEADKACFLCALESMEKEAGIVKKTRLNEKDYWFLRQPLQSIEQDLTISFETITMICAMLEDLSAINGVRVNFDPSSISERDLQEVLLGSMELFPKKGLT